MLAELYDVAGGILEDIMPVISQEVESVGVRCCAIPFWNKGFRVGDGLTIVDQCLWQ